MKVLGRGSGGNPSTEGFPPDKGFTLLEVMIALAILAGVVVTVLSSLNFHLGVSAYNREILHATILGKEKAEEIILLGLPDTKSGVFGEEDGGAGKYSWEFTSRKEEGLVEVFNRVVLKVKWEKGNEVSFRSFTPQR